MEQQNKKLDDLKIELYSKYEAKEKVLSDMIKYAKDRGLSEINDGFEVEVQVGSRFGKGSEIIFSIYDNNYIEGEKSYPKYFWSNKSRMIFKVDKNNNVEIDLEFSTGGMNSHEYGNKEKPKLDGVLLAELLVNHQIALLKFAKVLKSEPSIMIDYIQKQREAENEYYQASANYENEKNALNNIVFESNKAFIESKIKVAGTEKAISIIDSLTNGQIINPVQKIVIFEMNKGEFSLHAINIECIRGLRTTFRKIIRDDVGIKKSDALDYISKAILDSEGNLITSIEEFVKFINDNTISEKYNEARESVKRYSLNLNTEDVKNAISNGEIAKFLTTNNEKLSNENKKSLKVK